MLTEEPNFAYWKKNSRPQQQKQFVWSKEKKN